MKPVEDSVFDEKSARMNDVQDEMPISERYAPSHFSDRYPASQHSERWVGSQPPPQDEFMQDDANRYMLALFLLLLTLLSVSQCNIIGTFEMHSMYILSYHMN